MNAKSAKRTAPPKNPYPIRKVAVIGAGVMGAGIAAQVANAGIPVLLLDRLPDGAPKTVKGNEDKRNAITLGAIDKLKKTNPAALMHPSFAKRITPGNTTDHIAQLADCDWIIEAVIEKLDVKQALYKEIAKHRHAKAIVSSNTSTIPLETLVKSLPKTFQQHFLITHFFNPPRYLRLLELVSGENTLPEVMDAIADVGDIQLGKSVVPCNDTPGFIANRIGTFFIHAAVTKAIAQGITVEEADAILSRPIGVPKTGVFGLVDLVGLDLIPHVLGSLLGALPKTDSFHKLGPAPALMHTLIASGYTGRKGKGGFYRLNEQKKKEVLNLRTGLHEASKKPKLAALAASKKEGIKGLVSHPSPAGTYAWDVLSDTILYAAELIGTSKTSIADNIEMIDRAMRLGYNFKMGPFEWLDKMGVDWFTARLKHEGRAIPKILQVANGQGEKVRLYRTANGRKEYFGLNGGYHPLPRPAGVLLLEDVKSQSKPLAQNNSAAIWDLGDGVACVEFTSKMNTFNPFIFNMLNKAVRMGKSGRFKALVIYNEGSNFSVGANIGMLMIAQYLYAWLFVLWILYRGHNTFMRMKNAPFPIVAAPANMTLGGGCECVLHTHAVVAHAELYMGLVEAGVGLIPGWGGCKEMLGRATVAPGAPKGPMPAVARTFETIAMAKVSKSAAEARDLLFLRPTDDIIMNRDRVLAAAKARALAMVPGFTPPEPFTYTLPGIGGYTALKLALADFRKKGVATPHDMVVGERLARTLTGAEYADPTRPLTEEDLLQFERDHFVPLTKTKGTFQRVKHMLTKGKPLRN